MAEDAAARLAQLASAEGGDIDVKELLDAVLLASAWDAADRGPADPSHDAADVTELQEQDQINTNAPATDIQARASGDAAHTASVWLKDEGSAHIIPGKRVSVGRATPLPDTLDIGRALRPLRRPWLSGVHRRLDVDATVEHYTRTGMLIPRLTPAPEPWLDVIVVLDRGTAMAVWDEAVRALVKVLRTLAAFRDVRVWHLDHPPGDIPVLHDHHGRAHSMDPDAGHHTQPARRLLLIVSDCAAPAWRQDSLWQTLHTWGRTAPVALINPLPKRLWQRSGLDLPHTTATATAPASPGRLMSYCRPRLLRETDETKPWQALPVLQLAPDQVRAWARTLMRTDPSGCEAVLVPATGRPPLRRRQQGPTGEPDAPPTNDQVRAHAETFTDDRQSPAVRLAIVASPLGSFTLPVLDVLRDRLVPEATMADTAEFLTAGLLTAARRESADTVYHFHPAAAAHLTSLLTRDQLWATHFALSDHLAARLQGPHGIPVVLHSPQADETLPTGIRPIAYAAGTTARLLGAEPTEPQPEGRRSPAAARPAGSSSEQQPGAAHATPTMPHDKPQATELYRTLARHFRALLASLSGRGADYTSGPDQRPSRRGASDPVDTEEAFSDPLAIGAMELVGLERLRRRLTEDELLGLVRTFEVTAADLVETLDGLFFERQGGGARYLAANTRTAAEIALRLIETLADIETMPELRVGIAFGTVTMRTGDAVGRAATLASRLASVAPRDAVLVDSAFAEEGVRAGDAPASEAEAAEAVDSADTEGGESTSYRYALQPMWQRPLRGLGVVEPWLLTRRTDTLSAPRVVGALPLSGEAGMATSVTDAGPALETGRQIDPARARAPQQPSQDRQPEQEPAGQHGTTQGWDGGLGDRIPFLVRLEEQDRADLLALGSETTFSARTPLLLQHEPSNHILIIVSGWAKVTAATTYGYEALLDLRGPGDLVGEEAVLTERPRSTTVTALEPVKAVAVPGHRFTSFLQRHPGVSHHLLRLTVDRVQLADRRRLELASMSVRERFALLLLDLARVHGRRTEEGIELPLPLTTQELAGSMGASRTTTQRLLNELRVQNIVKTGRRSIEILRPDRLHAMAGAEGSPGDSAEVRFPHRGQENARSDVSKGIRRVEVAIKWNPSPAGQPPTALDLVAAAYTASDPYGDPAYAVHFDSRSPDSTMHLNRTSNDGAGFGWDEVMTLELDRLADPYARVVVGVVVKQHPVHRTFADVLNPALRIREGYTILGEDDFSGVLEATAVTVAEFVRDESGSWTFRAGIHGIEAFDGGTASFTAVMGRTHER